MYNGLNSSLKFLTTPLFTTSNKQEEAEQGLIAYLSKLPSSERWISITLQELDSFSQESQSSIILTDSISKANDPNHIFKQLRELIGDQQYIAFRVVTAENLKQQLLEKYNKFLFYLYYPLHFLFRRVFPKIKGFRKISRLLRIPVDLSKAEIMGRLLYTGFELTDIKESISETLFVACRNLVSNPSLVQPLPSEGFLFSTQRIGQYGKPIKIFKLRSMHPYAEYVQQYLHQKHGLQKGGKFHNDFRISTGGKFIRKYWLDELPMLINLCRGDLKLVGVRPLSAHYLSLYSGEAKTIRLRHKPGLLPPFYADLPTTLEEIMESEQVYLQAFEKAPLWTDLNYEPV